MAGPITQPQRMGPRPGAPYILSQGSTSVPWTGGDTSSALWPSLAPARKFRISSFS